MARKYLEWCLASLDSREMQIKTTGIPPHGPERGCHWKQNDKCWKTVETLACTWLLVGMWRGTSMFWKTVWRLLKKLKIGSSEDLAIPLLGRYPKELKAVSPRDICAPLFPEALFTVATRSKGSKCPSMDMDEWINEMWHIQEYYCGIYNNVAYTGILFSLQKGGNSVTCYHMHELWGHGAQWD